MSLFTNDMRFMRRCLHIIRVRKLLAWQLAALFPCLLLRLTVYAKGDNPFANGAQVRIRCSDDLHRSGVRNVVTTCRRQLDLRFTKNLALRGTRIAECLAAASGARARQLRRPLRSSRPPFRIRSSRSLLRGLLCYTPGTAAHAGSHCTDRRWQNDAAPADTRDCWLGKTWQHLCRPRPPTTRRCPCSCSTYCR
jgi:hypothetical protein